MATVFRPPLVQGSHLHPKTILPAFFQPVNLLCSTLGIAVAILLPLYNSDAQAWTQVQHPSRIQGYLNPDTSKGTAKTLLGEVSLPSGINEALQGVTTPDLVRTVVDTSRGSFRGALVEGIPSGISKPIQQAPEPLRVVVNTSVGSYRDLFSVVPLYNVPHQSPAKFWYQPADTTTGMAKVLFGDSSTPNNQENWVYSPEPNRSVVDTSKGIAKVLFTDASTPFNQRNWTTSAEPQRVVVDTTKSSPRVAFTPPSPFVPGPNYAPTKFWFQPADSTQGTPKVLYADATKAFSQQDWSVVAFKPYQSDAWAIQNPTLISTYSIVIRGRPHMTRTVMNPKFAGTTKLIPVDFISQLFTGETISTAVVTCSVYSGVDATPSALINGAASISGSIVTQSIAGGQVGTIYQLLYTITTSIGETLQMSAFLAINPPVT